MQRWVWTNDKPYFSYAEVSAFYSRTDTGKWGNSHANKFHFGKERGYCPCRKGACHGCVALRTKALFILGFGGLSIKASSILVLDWLRNKALFILGLGGLSI